MSFHLIHNNSERVLEWILKKYQIHNYQLMSQNKAIRSQNADIIICTYYPEKSIQDLLNKNKAKIVYIISSEIESDHFKNDILHIENQDRIKRFSNIHYSMNVINHGSDIGMSQYIKKKSIIDNIEEEKLEIIKNKLISQNNVFNINSEKNIEIDVLPILFSDNKYRLFELDSRVLAINQDNNLEEHFSKKSIKSITEEDTILLFQDAENHSISNSVTNILMLDSYFKNYYDSTQKWRTELNRYYDSLDESIDRIKFIQEKLKNFGLNREPITIRNWLIKDYQIGVYDPETTLPILFDVTQVVISEIEKKDLISKIKTLRNFKKSFGRVIKKLINKALSSSTTTDEIYRELKITIKIPELKQIDLKQLSSHVNEMYQKVELLEIIQILEPIKIPYNKSLLKKTIDIEDFI